MTDAPQERTHAFPIAMAEDFHRAKAALEGRGMLVNAIQPGGGIGTLGTLYGFNQQGKLVVRLRDLDRVAEILDELDIPHLIHQRPIVDRSEPVCPKCQAALDPDGPEVCPVCHAPFMWIEIETPEVDPTGRPCRHCFYELTGNVTDRCPECGELIEDEPDALVAAAIGEKNAWAAESDAADAAPVRSRAGILFLLGACTMLLSIVIAALDLNSDATTRLLGAIWLIFGLVAVIVVASARRFQGPMPPPPPPPST